MPENSINMSSSFAQGWALVKVCNEALANKDFTTVRQQLAAYFKLGVKGPSNLHSAILSIAVKLGTLCADFHLVPFLNIWGLQHLRPEDSDARVGEDGKRIPSLVERLAKSYAYALLFHPEEHIEPELEAMLFSLLQKKGFVGDDAPKICPLMATRLIQKEVRGHKMTFVSLISPDGEDFLAEVHTLTAFQRLRYDDIPGTVFHAIFRNSEDKGNIRIEAAIPTNSNLEDSFPTKVGYVEFIDSTHGHIHIYDNESRHYVSESSRIRAKVGEYVGFTPIIPKGTNFKTAIIRKVLPSDQGAAKFGMRQAKITYTDPTKGFASWELLPSEDGSVHPIVETGTTEPSFTKGYINQQLADSLNQQLPTVGTMVSLVVFLKRGKDKQKRSFVVFFK